jgi:hypothetical protein
MPTSDAQDLVDTYLGAAGEPPISAQPYELSVAVTSGETDPPEIPGRRYPPLVYRAPAAQPQPKSLVRTTYDDVGGLAGAGGDERAVPLGTLAVMALSPGGFGRVMNGRPAGGLANWTDASETSLSYVRPHVNVQMTMAMEVPGLGQPARFEGPGFDPHAYLDIGHSIRVDSADLGVGSQRFGRVVRSAPMDEPQTAVAVGLDLGVLPTFLAQMGMSVSLAVSRGQNTGSTRVALVGTTELPVDWAERERPIQHPLGVAAAPLDSAGPHDEYHTSGGMAASDLPPSPPPPPPPPPVPEPATVLLLGAGLAGLLVRRRSRPR